MQSWHCALVSCRLGKPCLNTTSSCVSGCFYNGISGEGRGPSWRLRDRISGIVVDSRENTLDHASHNVCIDGCVQANGHTDRSSFLIGASVFLSTLIMPAVALSKASSIGDVEYNQLKMPYCGNNVYARDLKSNGGQESFGSSTDCFRKGFGIGYNTPIGDATRFIAEWGGPYKLYIVQSIYYGDGAIPPGYHRATLGQSLSRGYALGRVAKA